MFSNRLHEYFTFVISKSARIFEDLLFCKSTEEKERAPAIKLLGNANELKINICFILYSNGYEILRFSSASENLEII